MAVSHVKNITIADGTNTDIVRGGDWNSAHNQYVTLAGNTSNASTLSGTNIVFNGSDNITLIGSNSSIVIKGAGGGAGTQTGYVPAGNNANVHVIGQPGQHSIAFAPLPNAPNFAFDRVVLPVLFSNASNSSNSWSLSLSVGLFSKNGSTLSLIGSTSTGASGTASGSVGSYSIWGAPKLLTIGWTTTINGGNSDLWAGVWSKTSANAGGQTLNLYLQSQVNSNFSGIVGVASSTNQQRTLGLGHYSATFSSAMPSGFSISQIQGTGSLQIRQPVLYFASGTV